VIDGDLGDWPMRAGNTASGFVLLGRAGRLGQGLAARQTQVFALHDRRHLYLAVRCRQPDAAALVARADNVVRYQQLLACGEDLVEVILDPGARGAGPEDLFHVVVKPNGITIAERGVGCHPPLGEARPWAAGLTAAVRKAPKEWLVELALPLKAFGPAGREELWGVNFCRFSPRGPEASNWAGATRYYYHPRNLGTMRLRFGSTP
jgi:hypothetical protein